VWKIFNDAAEFSDHMIAQLSATEHALSSVLIVISRFLVDAIWHRNESYLLGALARTAVTML